MCLSNRYYYDENSPYSCEPCADGCEMCAAHTGECIACKHSSFTLTADTCECDKTDDGLKCYTPADCGEGEFETHGNSCHKCSDNCLSCLDKTGACELCEEGFWI